MSPRVISRVVTAITVVVLAVGAWYVLRAKVGPPTVPGHHHTWALFRDASGLPVRSRVLIAGVQVGEIERLTIQGNLARVDMRLTDDVVLWDDAYAMKTGSIAFGDSHIELFPGGPDDPARGDGGHTRLRDGDPIPRVVEGETTDRFLRSVDRALPRVDETLPRMDRFVDNTRRFFDDSVSGTLAELDAKITEGSLQARLQHTDDAMVRFDAWSRRALDAERDVLPAIPGEIDSLSKRVASADHDLRDADASIRDALGSARTRLDDVDPYLARANAWLVRQGASARVAAAGGAEPERSGFGKAVTDGAAGETVDDALQAVADYTYTLDRIKTIVGLRNEFVLRARSLNAYLTMELSGRPDRFFLIELERGSIGKLADIEISDTPGGPYGRKTTITGGFRLSAQWGKRYRWFDYRFGLKESTFGLGADAVLYGGKLRFAADLYGENFSNVPRLKLEVMAEAFRSVYLFGGVDDALHTPGLLRIAPWPAAATSPGDYTTLSYGRDYFLGFMFKLNEEDAARMLRMYGAFVGAFL